MRIRKLIVLGGVGGAVAVGVTLWQRQPGVSPSPSLSALPAEIPVVGPSVIPPPDAARLSRGVDDVAAHGEPVAAGAPTPDVDDGDDHGQAQGALRPLEEPPPSRDAFGADPQSEPAALAEARATLEALLDDPNPAVKAQASALLETIAAP